jgi:uncharacterized membrane protein (DUF4010 family)
MALVLPSAVTAALVFALLGWLLIIRTPDGETAGAPDRNPLAPGVIVLSAVVYTAMSLFAVLSARYFGSESLPITAAVSGLADVDVAVLSMLRLQGGTVPAELLALAVLAAFLSNALFRMASAATIAPAGFSVPLAIVTLLALGAGLSVHLALPLLLPPN